MISACNTRSRLETASSRISNLGLTTNARARQTRWSWPPLNWGGRWSSTLSSNSTACSISLARTRCSAEESDSRWRIGSRRIARTVWRGSTALIASWNTSWMSRRNAFFARRSSCGRGVSCQHTRPCVGDSNPTNRRASVLLPQPLRPSRATLSPRCSCNEIAWRTGCVWRPNAARR